MTALIFLPNSRLFRVLFTALLQQFCDQSRPAGLMAGSDAGAVVAVEVFVKQDVIAKVRISLELAVITENRTLSIFILQKYARQPPRKLL